RSYDCVLVETYSDVLEFGAEGEFGAENLRMSYHRNLSMNMLQNFEKCTCMIIMTMADYNRIDVFEVDTKCFGISQGHIRWGTRIHESLGYVARNSCFNEEREAMLRYDVRPLLVNGIVNQNRDLQFINWRQI